VDQDLGEKFPAVFHALEHINRSLKGNPVSYERLEIEVARGHGAENITPVVGTPAGRKMLIPGSVEGGLATHQLGDEHRGNGHIAGRIAQHDDPPPPAGRLHGL